MLINYLCVALGGALGSMARYALALALRAAPGTWPTATLLVNVLGSIVIGVLAAKLPLSAVAGRALLMTGVLGGFTTMSSFSLEVVTLAEQGRFGHACAYASATLAFCLSGCFVGLLLGGAGRV